jgi:hypothetical protein
MLTRNKVENPLSDAGIILNDLINSYWFNVYHDVSEVLGQQYDNTLHFKQATKFYPLVYHEFLIVYLRFLLHDDVYVSCKVYHIKFREFICIE